MGDDLWPDIPQVPKTWTPAAILRDQASLLGKKTNNVVEGRVVKVPDPENPRQLVYVFNLVAPSLDYSYRLLSISHDITMYPLELSVEGDIYAEIDPVRHAQLSQYVSMFDIQINSEEELLNMLRRIFAAAKTKRVIIAMQAQAREALGSS